MARGPAVAGVVALAALGCAVRLLAARGELWVDEIWSLTLVAGLTSPDQVFWAVSHDNNHLLNALWLTLVGPDRAPILYRLPAVACGTASILVASALGFRRGRAAGVMAAALVAFGYPFVDYGSEARGYAGLILAILVSLAAFEPALAARLAHGPGSPRRTDRQGWWLACGIAFGTLSHFTMLAAGAVFALMAALRFRMAGWAVRATIAETVALFRPTLILLGPIAAVVAAGALVRGGFTVGGAVPYTAAGVLDGLGGLLRLTAGLSAGVPAWIVLAAAGLGLALAARRRMIDREDMAGAGAVAAIPALALVACLPNSEQPRYFLCCATLLVIIAARALGRCWEGGGARRLAAGCLVAASLLGQIGPTAILIDRGRGQAGPLLAAVAGAQPRTYATNVAFSVETVLDYYARRRGLPALRPQNDPDAFCRDPPVWYVHDGAGALPERLKVGSAACRLPYTQAADFPVADLSGRRMRLFRRDGPAALLQ